MDFLSPQIIPVFLLGKLAIIQSSLISHANEIMIAPIPVNDKGLFETNHENDAAIHRRLGATVVFSQSSFIGRRSDQIYVTKFKPPGHML